ncbi:MAG TPA: type II secretion system F family protein, partial [Oligoflexia bacterium]|nr:type II secretion system F family protein [Oligoflexia bacterium]
LAELYIGMSPEAFFFLRLVAALVCLALGILLLNFTIGLFLAAGGFVVPYFILKSQKEKRVRRVEAQLVDGLELLGNSLRSGLTLQQAVELLVREFPPPLSQEFSLVLAETRVGVEFAEALERMARRLDSNVVFILSTGIAIVKQCGGDMTQIFANIANTIREQATIEGKMHAVTAQGRFQGLILGLMPFALMFVLYLIDPTHIETLFRYQIGIWAFGAMVVMIILAQVWIRKLLELDV